MGGIGTSIKYVAIGILVVVGFVAYLYANNRIGQITESYSSSKLYLATNSERYVRCYNTENYGQSMLMDISIERLQFDTPDADKAKLNELEKSFLNAQVEQCKGSVAKYESEYKSYKQSINDYEQLGLLHLFASGSVPLEDDFAFNPSQARMSAGSPLTTLTFTKEQAEKYFDENL